MPQPDKLYRGFTEEKWKERLYRAYRYSSEPTKALWDMLRPFLEATDELESYKHSEDYKCNRCFGTGQDPIYGEVGRIYACIACNGLSRTKPSDSHIPSGNPLKQG